MNVFINSKIANNYDFYYQTKKGKQVDEIEKQLVLEAVKDIPKDRLLELGCGTGHWTEFFVKCGFDVTAIDISAPMLDIADKKQLNARFMNGDVHNIPFDDCSFPVVASITMLEFAANPEEALKEMHRVLLPGGWLVLGCLNSLSAMARDKEKDEIFKNAVFLSPDELAQELHPFGFPEINYGVYMSDSFEILDGKPEADPVEPVFMTAIVKKAL